MQYLILSAGNVSMLVSLVNEAIKNGWDVNGGMAVGPSGMLYQSMLKNVGSTTKNAE